MHTTFSCSLSNVERWSHFFFQSRSHQNRYSQHQVTCSFFPEKQESEIEKVKKACDRCREILAFVNQTVKEEEDKQVKIIA